MSAADRAVILAMIRYGGGFVKALGEAAVRADPQNLARLKSTFADYWQEYADLAALEALKAAEVRV